MAFKSPPLKRRKLNDDADYVPIELSQNQSEQKNEETNDTENRLPSNISNKINNFKANQLKLCLAFLKSLRTIDGERPFKDISKTGKKDELKKRLIHNIKMIYNEKLIITNKKYSTNKTYTNIMIDFNDWNQEIKQYLNKSKKSLLNNHKLLLSKLIASDKNEIIESIDLLLSSQQNGLELIEILQQILPKPNLKEIYTKHEELINMIYKSLPNSRFGSSRDNYCYNRCKSSIDTAIKEILKDSECIMKSKYWDTILEYLVITCKNINNFPVWDTDFNNKETKEIKQKLIIWYDELKKGLGKNINKIQTLRLQKLDEYLN